MTAATAKQKLTHHVTATERRGARSGRAWARKNLSRPPRRLPLHVALRVLNTCDIHVALRVPNPRGIAVPSVADAERAPPLIAAASSASLLHCCYSPVPVLPSAPAAAAARHGQPRPHRPHLASSSSRPAPPKSAAPPLMFSTGASTLVCSRLSRRPHMLHLTRSFSVKPRPPFPAASTSSPKHPPWEGEEAAQVLLMDHRPRWLIPNPCRLGREKRPPRSSSAPPTASGGKGGSAARLHR